MSQPGGSGVSKKNGAAVVKRTSKRNVPRRCLVRFQRDGSTEIFNNISQYIPLKRQIINSKVFIRYNGLKELVEICHIGGRMEDLLEAEDELPPFEPSNEETDNYSIPPPTPPSAAKPVKKVAQKNNVNSKTNVNKDPHNIHSLPSLHEPNAPKTPPSGVTEPVPSTSKLNSSSSLFTEPTTSQGLVNFSLSTLNASTVMGDTTPLLPSLNTAPNNSSIDESHSTILQPIVPQIPNLHSKLCSATSNAEKAAILRQCAKELDGSENSSGPSKNEMELATGSGIYIDKIKKTVALIKAYDSNSLARQLLLKILGEEFIANSSALGRNGATSPPKHLLETITAYVLNKYPGDDFSGVVEIYNKLGATIRKVKKRRESKSTSKNAASSVVKTHPPKKNNQGKSKEKEYFGDNFSGFVYPPFTAVTPSPNNTGTTGDVSLPQPLDQSILGPISSAEPQENTVSPSIPDPLSSSTIHSTLLLANNFLQGFGHSSLENTFSQPMSSSKDTNQTLQIVDPIDLTTNRMC